MLAVNIYVNHRYIHDRQWHITFPLYAYQAPPSPGGWGGGSGVIPSQPCCQTANCSLSHTTGYISQFSWGIKTSYCCQEIGTSPSAIVATKSGILHQTMIFLTLTKWFLCRNLYEALLQKKRIKFHLNKRNVELQRCFQYAMHVC